MGTAVERAAKEIESLADQCHFSVRVVQRTANVR